MSNLLDALMQRSENSMPALWLLNGFLPWIIPFNSQHRFAVRSLSATKAIVDIPFRRANKNHVGGIHACCLATGAELAAGLYALRVIGTKQARLVMEHLEVSYHAQARGGVSASVVPLAAQELETLAEEVRTAGISRVKLAVAVKDSADKLIASVLVTWHVKRWDLVRFRGNDGIEKRVSGDTQEP